MKKFLSCLLALLLVFPAVGSAAAEVTMKAAAFVPSGVEFDGTALYLANDPLLGVVLNNGETDALAHYMSLGGVLEQMGYVVNLDSTHNIVEIVTPGSAPDYVPSLSSISMQAGAVRGAAFNNHGVTINGTALDLGSGKVVSVLRGTEAHPQFFLPMRPVLEALGYSIAWDAENETIIVNKEGM